MFAKLDKFLSEFSMNNEQAIALYIENLDQKQIYNFNEKQVFYPASLIKLFAAFSCRDKLSDQKIKKAVQASLEDSDNDALSFLYDCITDSQSGSELREKRNNFSKSFHELGFSKNLKIHNKCFSFAPYGKDDELYQAEGSNQIMLGDIELIMKKIISEAPDLLAYMKRSGSDEQSEFIYAGLNASKLDFFYSKAGWTSTVRHDAAYFSYQGTKYLMVVLSKGFSDQEDLVAKLSSLAFID